MNDAEMFKMFTSFMRSYQSCGSAEQKIQATSSQGAAQKDQERSQSQYSSDDDSLLSKGIFLHCFARTVLQNYSDFSEQDDGETSAVGDAVQGDEQFGEGSSSIPADTHEQSDKESATTVDVAPGTQGAVQGDEQFGEGSSSIPADTHEQSDKESVTTVNVAPGTQGNDSSTWYYRNCSMP